MKTNLNEDQPIFIVGVPRSGTTLIKTMLSAHPNIAISPATQFFNHWLKSYSHLNISNPNNFESFWKDFSNSKEFFYFGIDAHSTLERILASNNISYKTIFTSLLQEYAVKMRKSRWGEKTPGHFPYVNKLLEWYPKAKIIWMLRDPRAVTASLVDVPWSSFYVDVNALHWRKGSRMLSRWTNDKRVLMIKFEELLSKPNQTLQKICEFIEEEYTSEMLENRSTITTPITNYNGWSKRYLQECLKPINPNSLEKWKSTLSLREIALIEHIARTEMINYDYQPITEEWNIRLYIDWLLAKTVRKMNKLKANLLSLTSNYKSS